MDQGKVFVMEEGIKMAKYQYCYLCGARTDRCEEDALWYTDHDGNDVGPLCEDCYDRLCEDDSFDHDLNCEWENDPYNN